jgi:REP element-mobilizing transposase RayT
MNDHLPHRRSIRLSHYDYSRTGAYFVTICAHERRCLFGRIVGTQVLLNPIGDVIAREWVRSSEMRPDVDLDAFVVMPNHLHGIVLLGRSEAAATTRPLGHMIRGFKAATTRLVAAAGHGLDHPLWQRNYYEHIIRNEESLEAVRAYIADNPARWAQDRQNPGATQLPKQDAAWQI